MKYQNLDDLLRNNKCPKDKKHTHTRIPNKNLNVYGGSYYISDDLMAEFWHHYYKKVFKKSQFEYLTERQLTGNSRLAIDFDFRYDTTIKERQHTEEHITDAIGEVAQLLNKHLIIESGNSFEVYVFEKPNLNCLDDITKDGIHVIVNINVPVEFKILLWQELWPKLSICWEDLPITNSWESVLDKGVFEGGTNWQVFGSRKPLHEAYELKYYYAVEKDDDEFLIEEKTIEDIDYKKLLPQISVRNNSDVSFDVCEKTKELMENLKKQTKKKKKKARIKFKKKKPNEITSREQIEEECNKLIKQKHKDDLDFEEICNYTSILGPKYYDQYEYWMKVGWALKSTNDDLFWAWMLLSSKSEKFKYEDIEEWKHKWDNEFDDDGALTSGSIRFWAKESNFNEFKKIRDESIQTHIQKTIANYTDFDIAMVLFLLYREEFVLAAHEKKKWFRFK